MTTNVHTIPMRSWMFVPGNIQRFLDKVPTTDADCVLLDIEDGVLPASKADARTMIANELESVGCAAPGIPQMYVRTNACGSEWFNDDLSAVIHPALDGICLPKVECADDVTRADELLTDLEHEHGIEPGHVKVVAAIESAVGLFEARAIAQASQRLVALIFGAEDFALDIGLSAYRTEEAADLVHARSVIVTAAAAARVLSIDGVFPNLDDPNGLEADAYRARRLGFDAKSTFNPRQVPVLNVVFSPQPDELAYARRVVDAFETAKERGEASVAVGGQLVDLPILHRAERLLAVADTVDTEGRGR